MVGLYKDPSGGSVLANSATPDPDQKVNYEIKNQQQTANICETTDQNGF